jgi:membrane protease YdiL (CAAX protease family)
MPDPSRAPAISPAWTAGARRAVRRRPRRADVGFAVASGAVLTAYNNLFGAHPAHERWYVPANACASGAALSAALASGLTVTDIGVGRGSWRPGRAGAGFAATVAAGWLVIAAIPATRPVLGDKRAAGLDARSAVYQALVRIPVGTVLWEEIAFRGVLQAALRRVMPPGCAIAVTSAVFGIWHVRPTVQALHVNGLTADRGKAVSRTAAGVAATAAGGALLSWLRERSGSLTAPVLLHLATNCGGIVAAWAVAGRAALPAEHAVQGGDAVAGRADVKD